MENVQYAKNGQLVYAVKIFEELTPREKLHLVFLAGSDIQIDDCLTFQVRYNKQGDLLGVQEYQMTDAYYERKHAQRQNDTDLLAGLTVLAGMNKHSKAYQDAKKRLGVSERQIESARRALNIPLF